MAKRTLVIASTALLMSTGYASFAQGNYSFDQAKSIVQSKDWNNLVQYGTKWSQAQPSSDLAFYCIGKGAFEQHKYSMAVENFQQAAQLKSNVPGYWGSLGDAYLAQGNKVAAVKAVTDGERACGNKISAVAWYNFGNILGQARQLDRAKVDLNKAVAINPKYGGAWTSLGLTEELQGNRKLAEQYYSKAAALGDAKGKNSLMRFRTPSMRVMRVGMKDPFDERNNPFLHNFLHQSPNARRVPLNNVGERINAAWRMQNPNANAANAPVGGH